MVKIAGRSLTTEVVKIFNFSSLTYATVGFGFVRVNGNQFLEFLFDFGAYSIAKYRISEKRNNLRWMLVRIFHILLTSFLWLANPFLCASSFFRVWFVKLNLPCIASYFIQGSNFRNNQSPKLHVNRSFSFVVEMLYVVNLHPTNGSVETRKPLWSL